MPESVSYQKKNGRAWSHPSFFWYYTDLLEFDSVDLIDYVQKKKKKKKMCHAKSRALRYPEIRYPEDSVKVPKVRDKWGLTVWHWLKSFRTFLCDMAKISLPAESLFFAGKEIAQEVIKWGSHFLKMLWTFYRMFDWQINGSEHESTLARKSL